MSSSSAFESAALEQVARLYRSEGYDVESVGLWPGRSDALANVDLIARRGDETVLIEVRRASRYARSIADDGLPALAREVEGMANARLDVVTIPDPTDILPARDELLAKIARATTLMARGADDLGREAGFHLAMSSLEGVLRVLVARSAALADPDSTVGGVSAVLWSIGLLSERQWHQLQALSDTRDALAHGLVPGRPLTDDDASLVVALVDTFVAAAYLEPEDVVSWFHERYKDPADGVPYNSREGGYLYVNGGPYEASDILAEAFENAPPPVIEAALEELDAESSEWVRVDEY